MNENNVESCTNDDIVESDKNENNEESELDDNGKKIGKIGFTVFFLYIVHTEWVD